MPIVKEKYGRRWIAYDSSGNQTDDHSAVTGWALHPDDRGVRKTSKPRTRP